MTQDNFLTNLFKNISVYKRKDKFYQRINRAVNLDLFSVKNLYVADVTVTAASFHLFRAHQTLPICVLGWSFRSWKMLPRGIWKLYWSLGQHVFGACDHIFSFSRAALLRACSAKARECDWCCFSAQGAMFHLQSCLFVVWTRSVAGDRNWSPTEKLKLKRKWGLNRLGSWNLDDVVLGVAGPSPDALLLDLSPGLVSLPGRTSPGPAWPPTHPEAIALAWTSCPIGIGHWNWVAVGPKPIPETVSVVHRLLGVFDQEKEFIRGRNILLKGKWSGGSRGQVKGAPWLLSSFSFTHLKRV